MSRSEYYESLKSLARDVRAKYGLTTSKVTLTDLRRIYRDQRITITYWRGPLKKIRGHYTNDELGPAVMVKADLPTEQRIFTLAHELKHHLVDREVSNDAVSEPVDVVEIGAEIFAVELIYPEAMFTADLAQMGVSPASFTPEAVVRLKRETGTTLSFTALGKLAIWLGYATKEQLADVKWKKLEESMYGEPAYKRIQRYRAMRSSQHFP